jgi:hypothetical protein
MPLREIQMARSTTLLAMACAALGLFSATTAMAQDEDIKIGVIYDFTGPVAAGGSEAAAIGTQIDLGRLGERVVPAHAGDVADADRVTVGGSRRLLLAVAGRFLGRFLAVCAVVGPLGGGLVGTGVVLRSFVVGAAGSGDEAEREQQGT